MLRRFLPVLLVFQLFSVSIFAQGFSDRYLLVSDVDDTLKITGVPYYREILARMMHAPQSFLGMAELFQGLKEKAEKVIYLSGSPPAMKNRLPRFLVDHENFPKGEFILSDWLHFGRPRYFKQYELQAIVTDNPGFSFLLFGDDTQYDPEVLVEFKQTYSAYSSARIYIHRVTGRILPPELQGELKEYSVPYEVALEEFEDDTLSLDQVLQVGQMMAHTTDPNRIFPSYVVCPNNFELKLGKKAASIPSLVDLTEQVSQNIHSLCNARHH